MPTYTYPDPDVSGVQWRPESMEWGQQAVSLESRSPYNGEIKTVDLLGHRWMVSMTYPVHTLAERPDVEAFWLGLRGKTGRVNLWDLGRPVPRGSMRGSPTLAGGAAFQANALRISTPTGNTLLAGDRIKVSNQLFVVRTGGVSVANELTVGIEHPVRSFLAFGSAVVWDKPTTGFMRISDELRLPRRGSSHPGFSIELVEVFQ
jgi:hypothetical protein